MKVTRGHFKQRAFLCHSDGVAAGRSLHTTAGHVCCGLVIISFISQRAVTACVGLVYTAPAPRRGAGDESSLTGRTMHAASTEAVRPGWCADDGTHVSVSGERGEVDAAPRARVGVQCVRTRACVPQAARIEPVRHPVRWLLASPKLRRRRASMHENFLFNAGTGRISNRTT